jgi:acyl-CoA reductase-like NAD-dependent aldehyde dehydrogenase
VIGGTLSALGIGSGGGEQLFRAREQTVSGDTLRRLQAAGVEYVPGPTRTEVGNLRLTRDEQTRYQQLTNTYVDENIRRLLQAPSWERMSARAREEAVQRVATAARERATAEMLRSLPIEDVRRRRAELAAGR